MKKITSYLLIICLLAASLFSMSAGAASVSTTDSKIMQTLSAMGVMSGYPDGSLGLSDSLTRAQMAKIIVMASENAKNVSTVSYTSPFGDVPYKHWSASYVKVAAMAGYMKGYSDGTFRPDQSVLYEEGITAVLNLLGYTSDDYGNSYPYGQISLAESLGLLQGLDGSAGYAMTRHDAMYLIYNALCAVPASGSGTYAAALGYDVSGGVVDLNSIIADNLYGPVIVTSGSWYYNLGIDTSDVKVYKNGNDSSFSAIKSYDVVYYNKSKDLLWVYSDKVTGVYQSASPDKNAPSTVTISGLTYTVGNANVSAAFGAGGAYDYGDTVTLLLGKGGAIAAVVDSTEVSSNTYGVITGSGRKEFNSGSGAYTSYYVTVVFSDGTELEYPVSYSMESSEGKVVKVSFDDDGNVNITSISSSGFSGGYVDADNQKVGSISFADDVDIIDTDEYGEYVVTYLNRIDGLYLDSNNVYHAEYNDKGEISSLILYEATGDTFGYGAVTGITEKTTTDGSSTYTTYTFEMLLDGQTYSLTQASNLYNIQKGPCIFDVSGSTPVPVKNLTTILGDNIDGITTSYIETSAGVKQLLAGDVQVYSLSLDKYVEATITQAMDDDVTIIGAYYDKTTAKGGRVRVILIK